MEDNKKTTIVVSSDLRLKLKQLRYLIHEKNDYWRSNESVIRELVEEKIKGMSK